jgi:hypothetical protein
MMTLVAVLALSCQESAELAWKLSVRVAGKSGGEAAPRTEFDYAIGGTMRVGKGQVSRQAGEMNAFLGTGPTMRPHP